MNTAKKTLKAQGRAPKSKNVPADNSMRIKVIGAITAIIVVILSIFIGYEQLHRPLIVTVNDSKIHLDDMMYFIYTSEAQGNYFSQMLGGDDSYWDMDAGEGKTIRETVKQEVLDTVIRYDVLSKEATKAGYKVTEEDTKTATTEVESIMSQLTDSQKSKTDFTKASLIKTLESKAIVDRYKKDLIDSFDIDDAAIKAGIDFKEYRQYDIQYYKIPTSTTDSEGNITYISAEEKKEAYNKLSALLTTAQTAEDFTKLVDEEDKTNTITFSGEANFTASGEWDLGDAAKNEVMKLENNKISGIIEADGAYIFVKMINNNSNESYDQAVKTAIEEKETEQFDAEYEKILKSYKVVVNDREWKKVKLGTVTN